MSKKNLLLLEWLLLACVHLTIQKDLDLEKELGRYRGSRYGWCYVHHDWEVATTQLFKDYFANNPIYVDTTFRHMFRMCHELFLCIF